MEHIYSFIAHPCFYEIYNLVKGRICSRRRELGIQTVIDSTISQGYSVITTAAKLENAQALKSIGANETNATNVLGLFAPGNMNMS
jgi:alkaline phosphatase